MAGLLDILLQRGEYMDPNKVLDQRMVAAGQQPMPDPRFGPAPVTPNTQPTAPRPPVRPNSMQAIMAQIAADREARQRVEAGQMLQRQNGTVLPRY